MDTTTTTTTTNTTTTTTTTNTTTTTTTTTTTARSTPLVTPNDVGSLLTLFAKTPYDSRETFVKTQQVLHKCLELLQLDYKCLVVPNSNGEICSSYPSQLIIPQYEHPRETEATQDPSTTNNSCPLTLTSPSPMVHLPPSFSAVVSRGVGSGSGEEEALSTTTTTTATTTTTVTTTATPPEASTDGSKLRELILKAKFARCRARFPIPVILYKGKYICRSSTLAGGPEMYGRSGFEYLFTGTISSGKTEDELDDGEEVFQQSSSSGEWQLFDRVRSQDIRLLKSYNVGVIVDLMVEKKKVKYGLNVTSSEKVDKENRYSDFSIVSLPYPGCEFFRDFRDSGYCAEGLSFNWNQAFVDAQLVIPERTVSNQVTNDWHHYRRWDLIRLTQNYLHLLLVYIQDWSTGLLVHCISGWDRTPLFISLLRMSLWADGLIHTSLGPVEMLYLTLAYDWLLFGHDLKDRLGKGEEILFFCFDFLKYITSEEFSVMEKRRHASDSSSSCGGGAALLLLDTEGASLSSSSGSLHSSSYSSGRSIPGLPPKYFRAEGSAGTHLSSWPYGSDNSDLDLDDLSPRLTRAASGSIDVGKQSVLWSRDTRSHQASESSSDSGPTRFSTSPVAVPVPRRQISHAVANTSLSSVGSWQIISTTGSLRGSPAPTSTPQAHSSTSSRSARSCELIDSTCTVKDCSSSSSSSSIGAAESSCSLINTATSSRVCKLAKVRSVFYNQYVTAIGFTACNGRTESGLGTLVSNFAQKVGIRPGPVRQT